MSIARIFEISKRSMLAYQAAIDTTAGNIANVNKEGYTRRRVDLSQLTEGIAGLGNLGLGVSVDEVTRIRQRMVQHQLYQEKQHLGKFEAGEMVLSQLESVFGEASGAGLSSVMTEFWNSWSDLANDPESLANRSIVKDRAVVMADTFNRVHSDLQTMQTQLESEIISKVDTVNQISNQISKINQQIVFSNSPELFDERDLLISDLAQLMNINVKEKVDGQVTISTSGLILVSDDEVNELNVNTTRDDEFNTVTINFNNMNHQPDINSGQLASLLAIHNKNIPDNINNLNILANSIANNVNSLHSTGYNLNNVTGVNFFDVNTGGASSFKVNSAVVSDPGLIATKTTNTGPGEGDLALAISSLQNETITDGQTASDYYISMLSIIGSEMQQTELMHNSQKIIVEQIVNQKESISGVSLDEEMTKLMQFEQSYEAAIRVMNTVDEMIQTLLAIT